MKLAVVGGRTFKDYSRLKIMLDMLIDGFGFTTIVSGGAIGADSLGDRYANERGLKKIIHLPNYDLHGRAEPIIRNRDIIKDCDYVLACWNKTSRGTANAIKLADEYKKEVLILHYNDL